MTLNKLTLPVLSNIDLDFRNELNIPNIDANIVMLEIKKALAQLYQTEQLFVEETDSSFVNDNYSTTIGQKIPDRSRIGRFIFEEVLFGYFNISSFNKTISSEYKDTYIGLMFVTFSMFYDIAEEYLKYSDEVHFNECDDVDINPIIKCQNKLSEIWPYSSDKFIIAWRYSMYKNVPDDVKLTLDTWLTEIECKNGVHRFKTLQGNCMYLGAYLAYNLLLMLATVLEDVLDVFQLNDKQLSNLTRLFRLYLNDGVKHNELRTLVNRVKEYYDI